MKKVDSATGMTIEVPESMAIRSKFPYPGFWGAVYPGLARAIKEHALPNENHSVINDALTTLIEVINGEQAVILTDRIWYIGELLNTNNTLAIEGRAGGALSYIRESKDGGRMAVAARVFEKPMRAVIQQSQGQMRAGNEMSSLLNQHDNSENRLQSLTRQLEQIEERVWSPTEITESEAQGKQLFNQAKRAEEERENTAQRIREMEAFRNNFHSVKAEYDAEVAEIRKMQNQIQIAQETNNPSAEAFSRRLAPVMQRARGKGEWLSRVAASADDGVLRDMQRLQQIRSNEATELASNYESWMSNHQNQVEAYENAVIEGRGVWAEMTQVTNHLNSMQSNITNAQTAMASISNVEASQLARIWVAHLKECRDEVERLLFEAKAAEMGAVTGSPKALLADEMVQPGVLKDYEEFIDALNMIGDALDDEEYDLIEEIGRLGLSMAYVPGASRVLALSELRKSRRLVAYRNLIEEILAEGQKLGPEEKHKIFDIGLPGFGPFVFEDDEDLAEVKELLRHLDVSRLNFTYGGD